MRPFALLSLLLTLAVLPLPAQAGTNQYRAALVKLFLSNYQAFPVFRANPVFPGDVLQLNEVRLLSYRTCYGRTGQKAGNYVALPGYSQGLAVSSNLDVKVGGKAIDRQIAEVEADGRLAMAKTVSLTVNPLAVDRFEPDAAALDHWARDNPDCKVIGDLLSGRAGGLFLVAEVLHGQVRFGLSGSFSGSLGVAAQGDLLTVVARAFSIDKASVTVSGSRMTFETADSPAPHTLAVVPARLSHEELARITYYLRGKRGADLEIAVREALQAADMSALDAAMTRISKIFGDDIDLKEDWAKRFVSGGDMRDIAALREDREISFRDVANFAAAATLFQPQPEIPLAAAAP
ncbi:MAG: hypothetical protein GC201_04110 [Alphaproteobacteria bacterium]|nr:hypothetical protein [Alphaproteobacteria bacterium]